MENDVINTTLYPTGYTPPTEDGEVSDQQMMQSGDGDLIINKQMMQTAECIDAETFTFSGPCSFVPTGETRTLTLVGGTSPYDWEFVGSHVGWTLAEAQTVGLTNELTCVAEPDDKVVTVQITDYCAFVKTPLIGVDDTILVDGTYGRFPYVQVISDGLVLVGYESPLEPPGESTGTVKSYTVDTDAEITYVASLEFYNTSAAYMDICLPHSGVAAVVYSISGGDLNLESILVAGDGTLSQHATNVFTFNDEASSFRFNVVARDCDDSGVCACTHDHGDGTVYVDTIGVADDGEVNTTRLDYFQCTVAIGLYPRIGMVTTGCALVVWEDSNAKMSGRTVSIASNGAIAGLADVANLADFELFTGTPIGMKFDMAKLKDNWMIVAAVGVSSTGWLTALGVSNLGVISTPTGYTFEFDDTGLVETVKVFVLNDTHIVVYSCSPDPYDGQFWVFEVSVGATVTWTQLEHYTYTGHSMRTWGLDEVKEKIMAIGYWDENNYAWMRTRRVCF